MKKQESHHETSHSDYTPRNRASLVADVHPCRQSQCPHFHASSRLAQSSRRLDRPRNLRSLRHQSHHLHSCATRVSGRRIGGGAARQATSAISPSLDRRTGGPSDRHRVQSRSHWPRPWTVRLLAGKAVELGFVESISPETIRQLLKKMNSSPGSTNSGASQR